MTDATSPYLNRRCRSFREAQIDRICREFDALQAEMDRFEKMGWPAFKRWLDRQEGFVSAEAATVMVLCAVAIVFALGVGEGIATMFGNMSDTLNK